MGFLSFDLSVGAKCVSPIKKKVVPDAVLFAVRIVYEFFVNFLYRPAAAVAPV